MILKGLCVGGPLDGQWLESAAPYYEVVERIPFPSVSQITAEVLRKNMVEVSGTVFRYVFWRHNTMEPYVWVEDGTNRQDLMDKLIEWYAHKEPIKKQACEIREQMTMVTVGEAEHEQRKRYAAGLAARLSHYILSR